MSVQALAPIPHADYALFVGLKLVGIVEAKKAAIDIPSVIDHQCKEYAKGIKAEHKEYIINQWGKYKVPFLKNDTIIFVGEDNLHYEKFADGSVKCIEDEIPFDLPDGWAWARIFSIEEDLPYGTAKKSSVSGRIAVLRMGNIQAGEIDYGDLVFSSDNDDIEKYTLKKGDLLFNRTNSAEWVGKTAIYRGNIPAIYAGYLIRLRAFINTEYLNAVMNSGYAKAYYNLVKTDGVNQSNINAKKLGAFLIPMEHALYRSAKIFPPYLFRP